MTEIHLVFPAGYDDPHRPSGGNTYDWKLRDGLAGLGWTLVAHDIPEAWPAPDEAIADTVERELALIPSGRLVLFDGLLGTAAATAFVGHAARLRLVALVHMPGPPGGPPANVLRSATVVLTTSQWTARTLIEHHALPAYAVVVAPPGACSAEIAAGTPAGGALVCVAAVTKAKGHDVLFSALAGLAAQPWTCVCVGSLDREPGFVEQLRRSLADNGITERVHFAGPLLGSDLDRAYAGADVVVLPTRLESYGMVVTEALARGVPVIATSVGGIPEALGRATDGRVPGIVIEPGDAGALSMAIASWLGSPTVRDDLRSAARSRRKLLRTWDDTASTVSTAMLRVTGG